MVLDPKGLTGVIKPGVWNDHPHAPGFGGEIAWNDITAIKWINAQIERQNRNMVAQHTKTATLEDVEAVDPVATPEDPLAPLAVMLIDKVYPLDPNGFPVQGYNQHDHTNQFFGGAIIGAGNHDHRGKGYSGYAFAVYHPGTYIPNKSLRIEI